MLKIVAIIEKMHVTDPGKFTFIQSLIFGAMITGICVFAIGSLAFALLAIARTPWFLIALPFTLTALVVCVTGILYTWD